MAFRAWRLTVAFVAVFGSAVRPAAGQDEPVGPSPIVPLDILWELDLSQGPSQRPAFDADHVYLPLRDGTLLALRLDTGQHVWARHRPVDAAPIAGDGMVITAAAQQLIGIRARDGRLLWTRRLDAAIATPLLWEAGWLTVALEGGTLAVFRGHDGEEMWRRDMGATLAVAPTIAGGRLYAPLQDGRIVALELATGTLLWERPLNGIPRQVLPLDALFVGSTDNFFYRLSLEDGSPEWFMRTGGDIVGAPAVDAERVYFSSLDNILRALDRRSGVQQWRRPLDVRPTGGPVRVDEALVVSGLSPLVQLYHAETGRPVGRYMAAGELAAPPHHTDHPESEFPRMMLVTGAGAVTALAAAKGPTALDPAFPTHPLIPHPNPVPLADVAEWHALDHPRPPPRVDARRFTVQVAIFDGRTRAQEHAQEWRDIGYRAFVVVGPYAPTGRLSRVRIGRGLGHGDAMRLIERLRAERPVDARLIVGQR